MRRSILTTIAIAVCFAGAMYTIDGCAFGDTNSSAPPPQPLPYAALRGRITDAVSAAPVANAHLVARPAAMSESFWKMDDTNAKGEYLIDEITSGNVMIVASAPGYETLEKWIVINRGMNRFDFALTPKR
jgi:hypothetical protein